ncbi:MAG: diadenylate cyclase CdaA [Oscillospiraceae bacterium]|nr:diadenylate cyclase CdaA [Oscillospiraceae bacterium]
MEVLINTLTSILKTISFVDIIDVSLVSILIYQLMKFIKDTRVAQILKGVAILAIVYFLAKQIGLRTIGFILEKIFDIGIVMLVVVFQPELRRMLEHVGQTQVTPVKFFGRSHSDQEIKNQLWLEAIENICEAVESLSKSQTGALIVLEKNIKLQDIVMTGTVLDSSPSAQLIENLFFKNSPLHDGGVIFRDGRVFAAGCLLPLSQNLKISKELGTRHRAALGMSEISDAVVIVVSEETGVISVAQSGHLARKLSLKGLKIRLEQTMITSSI